MDKKNALYLLILFSVVIALLPFVIRFDKRPRPRPPSSWSLKEYWPVIYDQGQIGSCTANAFCAMYIFLRRPQFNPSRLYSYYKARLLLNPNGPITDSGSYIITNYIASTEYGISKEECWPYKTENVNIAPSECGIKIKTNTECYKLPLDNMHTNIVEAISKNKPVGLEIFVYNSMFDTDKTGKVPTPNPVNYFDTNDPRDAFIGGHAVVIVGYDDNKKIYTIANSWGEGWADKGFCYIKYDYITDLFVQNLYAMN